MRYQRAMNRRVIFNMHPFRLFDTVENEACKSSAKSAEVVSAVFCSVGRREIVEILSKGTTSRRGEGQN
jgi:hypothetical protein